MSKIAGKATLAEHRLLAADKPLKNRDVILGLVPRICDGN